jgi:hypothetical protein
MPKLLALERFAFRDIIGIVIASFIIAIAIQLVIVPAYLLTGGLSGIAIILHFITDYPIWLWYIALNIPDALKISAQANRLAGAIETTTPATRINEIIDRLPQVFKSSLKREIS